jgi:hypothetical protein
VLANAYIYKLVIQNANSFRAWHIIYFVMINLSQIHLICEKMIFGGKLGTLGTLLPQ